MPLLKRDQRVQVSLYYQEKKTRSGFSKIIVLPDDKAKEIIAENEKKKDVPSDDVIYCLNTTWKVLSWRDQNDITKRSMVYNQVDKYQDIDLFRFRDERIKTCLVGWDLKDESNNQVPVTAQAIDALPAEIVLSLLTKYDEATSLTPDEEKN